MKIFVALAALCAALAHAALPTTTGWSVLPSTTLRTVCPVNGYGGSGYNFYDNCPDVVIGWNSGVMDTKRNRLIVWGGGHNGYYGNEVYAVNLNDQSIQRLTNPSVPTNVGGSCAVVALADGNPNSRHTYDSLAYLSNLDKMFIVGGSPGCANGGFSNDTWLFDFATSAWTRKFPSGPNPNPVPGIVSAYDPNTGKVFLHDDWNLYSYDPVTNAYTRHAADNYVDYHLSGVIDPVRKKFIMVGNGKVWSYDLTTFVRTQLVTTGGDALIASVYPGLAYNGTNIVAWSGGDTVYSLSLDTNVWTPTTYPGGPGPADINGTYKRWSYSPSSGVYVVVNSMNRDTYVLRTGTVAPTPVPVPVPIPTPVPTPVPVPVPVPTPTPTPTGDFGARCAAAGVVKCVSFDTDADFSQGSGGTNGAYGAIFGLMPPYGTNDYTRATRDSVVSASGSSLRFTIPSNTGSDTSGSWFTNFSSDLQTQFGPGESFYVQWRQRFSPEWLSTYFAGSGGWKQAIVGTGDVAGTTASSCSALTIVTQNTYQRGFPHLYNSCTGSASHGPYDPFEEAFTGSLGADFKLQNGRPSPFCLYSQQSTTPKTFFPPTGNCFGYFPNEWMTFQIGVKLGPRVNGEFQGSYVSMWIARDGQPSQLVHNWGPYNLTAPGTDRYGKVWLLPYQTGKDATQVHPTAYTWYDELIISRNKIADPSGVAPVPVPVPVPVPTPVPVPVNATTFAAVSVPAGTIATSNAIVRSKPVSISVYNGSYSIDGGPFITTAGLYTPGQRVAVRTTAPLATSLTKTKTVTLYIAGEAFRFVVTAQ